MTFQSTRPVRGATWDSMLYNVPGLFQSTRPVRGATLTLRGMVKRLQISIHAPRAGRDSPFCGCNSGCGGFQSTRPVRGATGSHHVPHPTLRFQSTHPVRGATQLAWKTAY